MSYGTLLLLVIGGLVVLDLAVTMFLYNAADSEIAELKDDYTRLKDTIRVNSNAEAFTRAGTNTRIAELVGMVDKLQNFLPKKEEKKVEEPVVEVVMPSKSKGKKHGNKNK